MLRPGQQDLISKAPGRNRVDRFRFNEAVHVDDPMTHYGRAERSPQHRQAEVVSVEHVDQAGNESYGPGVEILRADR